MSISSHCIPRESVFKADRRATVLNLDTFLRGEVDGAAFFEENYFTHGMQLLIDRALRHLNGTDAGSSVFLLSQAMGGGKTHSMIALGLLARDVELRNVVLGEAGNPARYLGACRVVGFNGRNTDARGGIWGDIAAQLGSAEAFSSYVSPIMSAPGPQAWKNLLGEEPLVIFLDELPPYLQYATAVPVGSSDLAAVTTAALANLFVAVAEMKNVCLVISDLAGSNYGGGELAMADAFNQAKQNIAGEARRIAVPITPVNPNGDEMYHILRKRLFKTIPGEAEIEKVAASFRDALREAVRMNLTSTLPETLYSRILESYPFHPDFGDLIAKFKENDGFQQTRGVIRLMQILVEQLYASGRANTIDLICPYDIDLNNDTLASEINTINPALSSAIAHDVAHHGNAEAEQIDSENGNQDASDAVKVILFASLSTTPGAVNGLREFQLVDCLQRPGRDLSGFAASVMEKLGTRAWYLHNSADGRLYFKNQQNIAAKLRSTAQSLHLQIVEQVLKLRIEEQFKPSVRDCYQNVKVLPPLDEVILDLEKTTLVVVRPGQTTNRLPIGQNWQEWWEQQQYKNRVLFVTGSRDTYEKLIAAARNCRAIESIEADLHAEKIDTRDAEWQALEILRDRVNLQFTAALKETFDQLVYPSINNALRSTNVELAFADNKDEEAKVRHTLESIGKFTKDIGDDSFRSKAESRLFQDGAETVLWSDLKRAAAVTTNWPLHKVSALEELKSRCIERDLWRLEGNYVRRGPFPPPEPEVQIRVLSGEDANDEVTYLAVEPLHATALVYETGDAYVTEASSPVPTPSKFEAKALRYTFMAIDKQDTQRKSSPKEWKNKLRLKYQLHHRNGYDELELRVTPQAGGIAVRVTTDGSAPSSSPTAAIYYEPLVIPKGTRVVLAQASCAAYGIESEELRIPIQEHGNDDGQELAPDLPAEWTSAMKLDSAGDVWAYIEALKQSTGTSAHDIQILLSNESTDCEESVEFMGSAASGYDGATLEALVEKLRSVVAQGRLTMRVGTMRFRTGTALMDWHKAGSIRYDPNRVKQEMRV